MNGQRAQRLTEGQRVAAANLLKCAHRLALARVPRFRHKLSKKRFSVPQLVACLALKELLRINFRATEELLRRHRSLRQAIGVIAVPDHSTLSRHQRRAEEGLVTHLLLMALREASNVDEVLALAKEGLVDERVHVNLFVSAQAKKTIPGVLSFPRWWTAVGGAGPEEGRSVAPGVVIVRRARQTDRTP